MNEHGVFTRPTEITLESAFRIGLSEAMRQVNAPGVCHRSQTDQPVVSGQCDLGLYP